jgi:hypothetical protein
VWRAGTPEPTTWQLVGSDGTLGPQVAGAIGVRTVNLSGASSTIRVDDLLATTLTTSGAAMTASITGAEHAGVGREVTLAAAARSVPEDFDVTYAWDLDGDGLAEKLGDRATAAFGEPGRHAVQLYAVASDGTAAHAEKTIVVTGDGSPVGSGPGVPPAAGGPVEGRSPGHGDARPVASALSRRLLVVPRTTLGTALDRGVLVTCRARCTVSLRLSAALAKRLRIARVIGSARLSAGRTTRVRITARARRALRRHRGRIDVVVAAKAGRTEMLQKVVLKR